MDKAYPLLSIYWYYIDAIGMQVGMPSKFVNMVH